MKKNMRNLLVILLISIFTVFSQGNTVSAAGDTLNFSAGGTLTINTDGTFTTIGGDISSGSMTSITTVTSTGDLTVILNNASSISLISVSVTGNMQVTGGGDLVINNTAGNGLTVSRNLEAESPMVVTGQNTGISVGGNFTLNNTTIRATATQYGVSVTGDTFVNSGTLYVGGGTSGSGGIKADGSIAVTGTTGRIESVSKSTYPVRAQKNITVNQGTIYVPAAVVDGITAFGATSTISVENGGLIEGHGDNCGIGSSYITVDNSKISGTSNRIGVSVDYGLSAKNNGIVEGTIADGTGQQDYGVIIWEAGTIKAETGGKIIGTGELGVVGYDSGAIIEASGGTIHGIGLQYGVESLGIVKSNTTGTLIGESTVQALTARGVGARGSMEIAGGTLIGYGYYHGVVSLGAMSVHDNGKVEGYATMRQDGTAAVRGATVTANNTGSILENYAGPLTVIDDITPINPYFNSLNMTDLHNYNWTPTSGKITLNPSGILAKKSATNTVIEASRIGLPANGTEVVSLGSTGVNEHIIQLPVTLEATPILYTLSFDLNGKTGSAIPNQTLEEDSISQQVDNPVIPGYTFLSWNTERDGSGDTWNLGSTVMPAKNVTLYAQWQVNTYVVHFDPNNGIGNMPDEPFSYNESKPLYKDTYTREGYTFIGWSTSPSGPVEYEDEGIYKFTATEDVTLYAQWSKNEVIPEKTTPTNIPIQTAKTGDSDNLLLWSLILIGSLGTLSIINKKKKKI